MFTYFSPPSTPTIQPHMSGMWIMCWNCGTRKLIIQRFLGGGNSNVFYFHPETLGKMDPIWRLRIFFQMGWWVQPPFLGSLPTTAFGTFTLGTSTGDPLQNSKYSSGAWTDDKRDLRYVGVGMLGLGWILFWIVFSWRWRWSFQQLLQYHYRSLGRFLCK